MQRKANIIHFVDKKPPALRDKTAAAKRADYYPCRTEADPHRRSRPTSNRIFPLDRLRPDGFSGCCALLIAGVAIAAETSSSCCCARAEKRRRRKRAASYRIIIYV